MSINLDYKDYLDRIHGGWLGKSLGGLLGAPYENQKQYHNLGLDSLNPTRLVPNDDLDLQLMWLEALQERGLYLTSKDLVEIWQSCCRYNFCEYGVMLHNVQRGINPPLSGTWNNSFFSASEGCPIRSEIWGFICPDNPALAAEYAAIDGAIDHGTISIQVEMFLAAMMAKAVTGGTLQSAIDAGRSVLPADSRISLMVDEVRDICRDNPEVKPAWRQIIRRYGHRDASNAITNHAIVLMSWFLGCGDMAKTILICVNSGWDADCTAATAGAILGALGGTSVIPKQWRDSVGDSVCCAIEIAHKNSDLYQISKETAEIGIEMTAERNLLARIINSPAVTIRKKNLPAVEIAVTYENLPVLLPSKKSVVNLTISNRTSQPKHGTLSIRPAHGTIAQPSDIQINLPADGSHTVDITASLQPDSEWISDKNIFDATWNESENSKVCHNFGLVGARQWLVYGPYWDMWDKTKNEICPYNNAKRVCIPGAAGYASDNYNQYADLNRSYLDETQLLKKDIPTEAPFVIQKGEDLLCEKDFGGFVGQACYYLTRTIYSDTQLDSCQIYVGRSAPYKLWIDGELIGQDNNIRCWAQHEDEGLKTRLTGKPQRIVLKLVCLTDEWKTSLMFIVSPSRLKGISYIHDGLKDKIVHPLS